MLCKFPQTLSRLRRQKGISQKQAAEELGISATALYARLKALLRGVLGSTCEALALPDECGAVLDTIKSRAARLIETVS